MRNDLILHLNFRYYDDTRKNSYSLTSSSAKEHSE